MINPGSESRDHLRAITPPRVVMVPNDRDPYGRIIGEVLTADRQENLNLAQVGSGHAPVYRRYCSDRRYYAAEASARVNRLGIWALPGGQQRPWEQRHRR